jgi:hypothetical protein
MPLAHPIPGKFDQDPRVSFDKTAGKWQYEDEQTGQEFEFNEHAKTWLPLVRYPYRHISHTDPSLARRELIQSTTSCLLCRWGRRSGMSITLNWINA